jgi:hypothetical protein
MYQNRGNYQVGGQQFDIDPAWTNILYGPLKLNDFSTGFAQTPGQEPITQVPSAPPQAGDANGGTGQDNQGYSGGGNPSYSRNGIDPNTGLSMGQDYNYSSPDFWGGWDPNVSTLEALKQSAPMIYGAMKNPFATALRSMKLDPVLDDKLFQSKISTYLSEIGSPIGLKDFMAAYKDLIENNWDANVNRTKTAQGMLLGQNPEYKGAFDMGIKSGMNYADLADWSMEAQAYNSANPDDENTYTQITSVIDPRTATWATPVPSPIFKYATEVGLGNEKARELIGRYNPDAFTNKLDAALAPYGTDWQQFQAGVRNGWGPGGADGYDSQEDYASAVAAAVAASSARMDAVNDLDNGNGGGGGNGGMTSSGGMSGPGKDGNGPGGGMGY